jgi:hypothetical protein
MDERVKLRVAATQIEELIVHMPVDGGLDGGRADPDALAPQQRRHKTQELAHHCPTAA